MKVTIHPRVQGVEVGREVKHERKKTRKSQSQEAHPGDQGRGRREERRGPERSTKIGRLKGHTLENDRDQDRKRDPHQERDLAPVDGLALLRDLTRDEDQHLEKGPNDPGQEEDEDHKKGDRDQDRK